MLTGGFYWFTHSLTSGDFFDKFSLVIKFSIKKGKNMSLFNKIETGLRVAVAAGLPMIGLSASNSSRQAFETWQGENLPKAVAEYVPEPNDDVRLTINYPGGEVQILNCHAGVDDSWRGCLGWFENSLMPAYNSSETSDDVFTLGTLEDGAVVSAEILRDGKKMGILVCRDGKIIPADPQGCTLVKRTKSGR